MEYEQLQEKLGYAFRDTALLKLALTHPRLPMSKAPRSKPINA
jgi:dsRNA-specific ribonuclease